MSMFFVVAYLPECAVGKKARSIISTNEEMYLVTKKGWVKVVTLMEEEY